MHGVRRKLIEEQARAIGVALHEVFIPKDVSNGEYEKIMEREMKIMKENGVSVVVFGDIFLENVRSIGRKSCQRLQQEAFSHNGKETQESL